MKKRACCHCGQRFTPKVPKQIYCCELHRIAAWKKANPEKMRDACRRYHAAHPWERKQQTERPCLECGKIFTPKNRKDQVYCCANHRAKATKRRLYAKYPERYGGYARGWRARNPETVRKIRKRWYYKNLEKCRQSAVDYYWKNTEKVRVKNAKRYARYKRFIQLGKESLDDHI